MSHLQKLTKLAIKLNPNELLVACAETGDLDALTTLLNADQNQQGDVFFNPAHLTPYQGIFIEDLSYNDALIHAVDEGQLECVNYLVEMAAHRMTADTVTSALFVLLQQNPKDYKAGQLKAAQQVFLHQDDMILDPEVIAITEQILKAPDPTTIIKHFDRHFAWHAQRLEIEKTPEDKKLYITVYKNDNVQKTMAPKTRFLKSVK